MAEPVDKNTKTIDCIHPIVYDNVVRSPNYHVYFIPGDKELSLHVEYFRNRLHSEWFRKELCRYGL